MRPLGALVQRSVGGTAACSSGKTGPGVSVSEALRRGGEGPRFSHDAAFARPRFCALNLWGFDAAD